MTSISSTGCCGVDELVGLRDFTGTDKELLEIFDESEYMDYGHMSADETTFPAFFTFTQVTKNVDGHSSHAAGIYGDTLAKMVKRYKLGKVTSTSPRVNGTTGNRIKLFVWAVNKRQLATWLNQKKKKELKPREVTRNFYNSSRW